MMEWELRPHRAGATMAHAIIEMVNLMYQNITACRFLTALIHELQVELDRRDKL